MSSTRIPATDRLLATYRGPVLVGITPAILLGPHPDGGWRVWAEVFSGAMRVRTESVALDVAEEQARDFVVGRLAAHAGLDTDHGVWWTATAGCCEIGLCDPEENWGSGTMLGSREDFDGGPLETLAAVAREVLR